MGWLGIPLAFGLLLVASFLAFLLFDSAWERRQKKNAGMESVLVCLPGYDCGLCGHEDCRRYAAFVWDKHGDPGLCSPGAGAAEAAIRKVLGDDREEARMAFVRCSRSSDSRPLYEYDGRKDCRAAFNLFGGPVPCPDACLGLGSCLKACPVKAVRMEKNLAVINADLCTGCGLCVQECPNNVIALVPRQARWQVACNSQRSPEEKKADCKTACIACGACARMSTAWEFSVSGNLAHAIERVSKERKDDGDWEALASLCPTKAIVRIGSHEPPPVPESRERNKDR